MAISNFHPSLCFYMGYHSPPFESLFIIFTIITLQAGYGGKKMKQTLARGPHRQLKMKNPKSYTHQLFIARYTLQTGKTSYTTIKTSCAYFVYILYILQAEECRHIIKRNKDFKDFIQTSCIWFCILQADGLGKHNENY